MIPTTLTTYLELPPQSYAEEFKPEIFFALQDFWHDKNIRYLIEQLKTEEEMKQWVDGLTSYLVMHEDEDSVSELIADYLYRIPPPKSEREFR